MAEFFDMWELKRIGCKKLKTVFYSPVDYRLESFSLTFI